MPYRSAKQRRFMHWAHPEIANRWDKEYGGKVVGKVPSQRTGSKSMISQSLEDSMDASRYYSAIVSND